LSGAAGGWYIREPGEQQMIELELTCRGEPIRQYRFDQQVVFIGRDPKNDVAFEDRSASRHHARIVRGAQGYELEDLGSRNGTRVNERPAGRVELKPRDQVRIGAHTLLVQRIVAREEPRAAPVEASAAALDQTRVASYGEPQDAAGDPVWSLQVERDGQMIASVPLETDVATLGRDPASDVVLPDDDVSRHHARILRKHGKLYIEDRDSLNGTLVDGEPVYTSRLTESTEVRIGPYRLRLLAAGAAPAQQSTSTALACLSCGRGASAEWPGCPFCAARPGRSASELRLELEPLKAPDPAVALLDGSVTLRLSEETVASERHLWVSFEEGGQIRHPVGQVPDQAAGCPRCLYVAPAEEPLHVCPACAAERLGQLPVRNLLHEWMAAGPVEVRLRRITPRGAARALVEVVLRTRGAAASGAA
jgi:pSer/pThr/pTyr-binding forkhead associated (FHA) protein